MGAEDSFFSRDGGGSEASGSARVRRSLGKGCRRLPEKAANEQAKGRQGLKQRGARLEQDDQRHDAQHRVCRFIHFFLGRLDPELLRALCPFRLCDQRILRRQLGAGILGGG